MRRTVILFSILVGVSVAGTTLAALKDDRFKGGRGDGYDRNEFAQTSADPGTARARFKGSGYDGYANEKAEGLTIVLPVGLILIIK